MNKVLAMLAQQTQLNLTVHPDVRQATVSVEFRDVPLAQGIRKLLKNRSYALEEKCLQGVI
ncbi:MAG: hypothetical protein GY927_14375, partial [bacterium]|nr:hypothetical protein [bacterium]